jgi:NAD(P)H-nitrite reductase large subunit
MNEQEIIDGLKVICTCRNIRKSVFRKHMRTGLLTVEELQRATGAGTGTCKGKECTPKIAELLKEAKK